jgi:UDP-galactopyranose mutase
MLRHPNIRVMLNTAYHDVVDEIQCQRMIFTGQIDAFLATLMANSRIVV